MNVRLPQETLSLPEREDLTYSVYGFSKQTNITLISRLDKVWSLLRSKHTESRRLWRVASAPGFPVGRVSCLPQLVREHESCSSEAAPRGCWWVDPTPVSTLGTLFATVP